MTRKAKEYSVILKYPDYCVDGDTETYLAHVYSSSVKLAVKEARKEVCALYQADGDDFSVLAVFPGHLTDLNEE